MKKLLYVLLSVLMLTSLLPGFTFAAAVTAEGTCGPALTWTLDDAGVLTISGAGAIPDYTTTYLGNGVHLTNAPWGGSTDACAAIRAVKLEEGVTAIGANAFSGCASLTEISLPAGLTEVGDFAFNECAALTEIALPAGVARVGKCAFEECASLKKVSLPDGMTTLGAYAFRYCAALNEIRIPAGVRRIENDAFYKCTSLKTVTLTDGLEQIGDRAFSSCNALERLRLPDGLREIGEDVFSGCASLAEISFPDTLYKVGGEAFYGTPWLETQPDGLIMTGKTAYDWKGDMAPDTDVVLPEGTLGVTRRLLYKKQLRTLTVPAGVLWIDVHFQRYDYESYSLQAFRVAEDNPVYSSRDGVLFTKDRKTLLYYPAGKTGAYVVPAGVTEIGDYAFTGAAGLTAVTFPDGLRRIGRYAFWCDRALAALSLPDSLTGIGEFAFAGCRGITGSVSLPDGVTDLQAGVFDGCSGIVDLHLGENTEKIGYFVFSGCTGLTEVRIPGTVRIINTGAFQNCTALRKVVFADGAEQIAYDGLLERKIFLHCPLEEIVLPDSLCRINGRPFDGTPWLDAQPDGPVYVGKVLYTYKGELPADGVVTLREDTVGIAAYAFHDRTALREIILPEGLRAIGVGSFGGCAGLCAVSLPRTLRLLDEGAFCGAGLTALTLPEGLTEIGNDAVSGCASLTELTIPDSVDAVGIHPFSGTPWYQTLYDESPTGVIYTGRVAYAYKGELPENGTLALRAGTTGVADEAFQGKYALRAVVLPAGVRRIGGFAFSGCRNLSAVELPATVTEIGRYAFYGTPRLETVTYGGTAQSWAQIRIGEENDSLLNAARVYAAHTHSFGEWTVRTPASADAAGLEFRVCGVCGQEETREIPPAGQQPGLRVVTAETVGDVDGDGRVSAGDARLALRASVGLENLSDDARDFADADRNGAVNAADARLILRASVELEDLAALFRQKTAAA